jgi:hypothetical protein
VVKYHPFFKEKWGYLGDMGMNYKKFYPSPFLNG